MNGNISSIHHRLLVWVFLVWRRHSHNLFKQQFCHKRILKLNEYQQQFHKLEFFKFNKYQLKQHELQQQQYQQQLHKRQLQQYQSKLEQPEFQQYQPKLQQFKLSEFQLFKIQLIWGSEYPVRGVQRQQHQQLQQSYAR